MVSKRKRHKTLPLKKIQLFALHIIVNEFVTVSKYDEWISNKEFLNLLTNKRGNYYKTYLRIKRTMLDDSPYVDSVKAYGYKMINSLYEAKIIDSKKYLKVNITLFIEYISIDNRKRNFLNHQEDWLNNLDKALKYQIETEKRIIEGENKRERTSLLIENSSREEVYTSLNKKIAKLEYERTILKEKLRIVYDQVKVKPRLAEKELKKILKFI